MFSSRILREESVRPYLLRQLGEALPPVEQGGFRPLLPGDEAPPEEGPEPVELMPPQPAPAVMPEEEALALVRQAHADGVRDGRAQAGAELSAASRALAEALSKTAALHAKLLHDAEEDLLKLAVLIARRVMLRELSCDPGILAGLVRGAVELVPDADELLLRLHPEDHALVAAAPEFEALLRENPGVSVKADPSVPCAGCLLETSRGNIDAGMDAQLDEILRRLLEERSARREGGDD
jgi:flagellar assembly protein FliH